MFSPADKNDAPLCQIDYTALIKMGSGTENQKDLISASACQVFPAHYLLFTVLIPQY